MTSDAIGLHPSVIPGYQGGPYSDHRDFLGEHLFWIGHIATFFHGLSAELDELLLGPDEDASQDFHRQIFEAADWPVFTVPLEPGGCIYVVYRTFAEDKAIDLLIHQPGSLRAELVASTEAHPTVPELTWAELVGATSNGLSGGSTQDRHERMLLLLPALGSGDLADDAAEVLAEALTQCTAVDDPERIADLLLSVLG